MPNRIFVTKEKCIGCAKCVPACPVSCMTMVDRDPAEGVRWKKLVVIDEPRCVYCNACVEVCNELGEQTKAKTGKADVFFAITMEVEKSDFFLTPDEIAQYKDLWIFAEQRFGKLSRSSYELLNIGRKLNETLGEKTVAVLMGHNVKHLAQDLIEHGADKVYVGEHPILENFLDEPYTEGLAHIIRTGKPNKFLMPASTLGRSFSSRVAAYIDTGLTADATELDINPKTRMLHATRPTFGGNLMATILCARHRPEMASVRPGNYKPTVREPGRKGEIIEIKLDPSNWKVRSKFVEHQLAEPGEVDLSQAEIIVSGGRGVGGPDGFQPLKDLVHALGSTAAVGASRVAVDSGWISYRHQVGLTGRTVHPKIYIAAGISGQIQHLAGMSSSDVIIAINKDPEAPLMGMATIAVEGDLFEIIPAITEEIKKLKGK